MWGYVSTHGECCANEGGIIPSTISQCLYLDLACCGVLFEPVNFVPDLIVWYVVALLIVRAYDTFTKKK